MKAPAHWYHPTGSVPFDHRLVSAALLPLGFLYATVGRIRRALTSPIETGLPVICVGNLTAGGTGKTPITMALATRLRALGHNPHILTRGYGGALRGPVLVKPDIHIAADVGDEPLLLSRSAPTWVSRRRGLGALAATAAGADILIMDDGFQNNEIAKTVSILVIDGEVGLGNHLVIPAGPLRETVTSGFARADAMIIMGEPSVQTTRQIMRFPGPIFHADLQPVRGTDRKDGVLAFAGIGRPEKFFKTLSANGNETVIVRSFPDHHVYSEAEIEGLRREAQTHGLAMITTEKDWIRLPESQRRDIRPYPVVAAIKEEQAFVAFLSARLAIFDRTLHNADYSLVPELKGPA